MNIDELRKAYRLLEELEELGVAKFDEITVVISGNRLPDSDPVVIAARDAHIEQLNTLIVPIVQELAKLGVTYKGGTEL